ncbi:phosphotransferase [Salinigranum halophilum]|uniref:phosphotransferase n=1 Tax=Salinigranum halophilum TaxID=2565931 RepID=UPI0010A936E9|nr:phosphotransferase [Salinigranum halophilum]
MDNRFNPDARTSPPQDELDQRVKQVTAETLNPAVRTALGDDAATLTDWSTERLHGGVGGGYGGTALYRFSGRAISDNASADWSVILKILAERDEEPPTATTYWRRELDFYQSDIPAQLRKSGNRFVPAELYEVQTIPGESTWLWLEDLDDVFDGDWPLEQYGRAATHLGEFSGTCCTGEVPTAPWLGERPFDFDRVAEIVGEFEGEVTDEVLEQLFPTPVRQQHTSLWSRREEYQEQLTSLPRTICHFDAFKRNLFARRRGADWETAVIDWNRVGHGAVGEDPASLTFLTVLFDEVDPEDTGTLDETVFECYIRGLRSAGWDGDRAVVRLGYLLHLSLRWLEWTGPGATVVRDSDQHSFLERTLNRPIERIRSHFASVNEAVQPFIDELYSLSDEMAGKDND